ncbi:putative Fe-containing alcohol dehydrogenase [Aulographum hederae CBS 113979]|uniref:Putative Fe-containing alcohol dehydrogenase n=1 Tax=Aulographum hederae CBS 113979 TaxID=1176131 RepID=A0A6G1HBU3_9PEZI|nr:putative Fe-containing alcohol dehydrogenase [Aulographum hederae CBS 113979]
MTETYRPAFEGSETPHISYGIPFHAACAKHLKETFKCDRVHIIASRSLCKNTNHVQMLKEAIERTGILVTGVRHGMTPHTFWSEVLEIVRDAREMNADMLVTIGGGSLTDAAKIVALALSNNARNPAEIANLTVQPGQSQSDPRSDLNPPTLRIVSISTSFSGGEYARLAGGTDDRTKQKHAFLGPIKGPELVILDPELVTMTPKRVWAASGVRAVDHCVEALCSLRVKEVEGAEEVAGRGLRRLVKGLLRCQLDVDGRDVEARMECQLGVVDAMEAVIKGVEMGGSHAIGHQLGPLGVAHGETSCILLPAVCRFNRRVNEERQRKVEEILWGVKEMEGVLRKRGLKKEEAELGDMLKAIIEKLDLPTSLKDVGIEKEKFEVLAENSLKDRWSATNPIPLVEKEQILDILEMAAR